MDLATVGGYRFWDWFLRDIVGRGGYHLSTAGMRTETKKGSILVREKRNGFTLVELLAVIAILGLLMGILLPSLSAARRAAKASACLATMKNIGNASIFYLNENRDTFMPGRLKKGNPRDPDNELYVNDYYREAPRWPWFLEMGQGPIVDPSPVQRGDKTKVWGDDSYPLNPAVVRTITEDTFNCPSLTDPVFERDIRNGAYGYNYQYLGNGRQDSDPMRWDNFAVSLHQITSPAKTVAFADSRGGARGHGEHSYTLDPPRLATEKNATRFGPGDKEVPEGFDTELYGFSPVEARHKDRGNAIFVDGHGEAMTLKQFGYDWNEEFNVAQPIRDTSAAGSWNNKLWTGTGRDRFVVRP